LCRVELRTNPRGIAAENTMNVLVQQWTTALGRKEVDAAARRSLFCRPQDQRCCQQRIDIRIDGMRADRVAKSPRPAPALW
jgi:hypothetical protein